MSRWTESHEGGDSTGSQRVLQQLHCIHQRPPARCCEPTRQAAVIQLRGSQRNTMPNAETWARKQRDAVGCSPPQERNLNLCFDELRWLSFSFMRGGSFQFITTSLKNRETVEDVYFFCIRCTANRNNVKVMAVFPAIKLAPPPLFSKLQTFCRSDIYLPKCFEKNCCSK